jgi:GcrA cell cycle regulator
MTTDFKWNNHPEAVEKLKELWVQGLSARGIARTLAQDGFHVSRNSVIGKVTRLGLTGRAGPRRDKLVRVSEKKKPKPESPAVVEVPLLAPMLLPDGTRVTAMTVTDRMCRWPYGDAGAPDFHFCGHPPGPGIPYCIAHWRQAHEQKSRRESA